MVKPGDLGLVFSDSSAKDFSIEIDRVKVLQAVAWLLVHHSLSCTIRLINRLNPYVTYSSAQHDGPCMVELLHMYSSALWQEGRWHWMQAMPTGEETDFILVSCAGALVADDEPVSAAAVLSHKRKGEQALRHSGLGYTIIRPGPLLEEPGGYKALVFDQARVHSTERLRCPWSDQIGANCHRKVHVKGTDLTAYSMHIWDCC